MGKSHLCENAHFIYKILQYTCFSCICYTYSYNKFVWDMSQYNKPSDIQYARFLILPVDLHFETFGQLVFPPWRGLVIVKEDLLWKCAHYSRATIANESLLLHPCNSHDHDHHWADLVDLITLRQRKCEHKVVRLVWEFDCLHFAPYISISLTWHWL